MYELMNYKFMCNRYIYIIVSVQKRGREKNHNVDNMVCDIKYQNIP